MDLFLQKQLTELHKVRVKLEKHISRYSKIVTYLGQLIEKHHAMEDNKFCIDDDVEKIKELVDIWKTRLAVVVGVLKEVQVPHSLLELCLERVEVLGLSLEDLPSTLVWRVGAGLGRGRSCCWGGWAY